MVWQFKSCPRADVSYSLCCTRKRDDIPFTRAIKEIGDVCTQAIKERLGQGSFGDVYIVDYEAPGKVAETVVVKKILQALYQDEKKLFYKEVALNGYPGFQRILFSYRY